MIVRRETPADYAAVRALFAAVYSPDLLDALRASDTWSPGLSFVAIGADGEVVGHIGSARGRIGSAPALVSYHPASSQTSAARVWGRRCSTRLSARPTPLTNQSSAWSPFRPSFTLGSASARPRSSGSAPRSRGGSYPSWFVR